MVMESVIQEAAGISDHSHVGITNTIDLKIDRASYINPYDVSTSIDRINALRN